MLLHSFTYWWFFWHILAYFLFLDIATVALPSVGHEPKTNYFAWLEFGISNELKKSSNSTQFML